MTITLENLSIGEPVPTPGTRRTTMTAWVV